MTLSKLIGHEFVLVPFLLACVQLLGKDQQGFLLTLQLPFTHQVLQNKHIHVTQNCYQASFLSPALELTLCRVDFALLLFVFRDHIPRDICHSMTHEPKGC